MGVTQADNRWSLSRVRIGILFEASTWIQSPEDGKGPRRKSEKPSNRGGASSQYCTDMTNLAVISHHKFRHCWNVTYVISHHKNCRSADGMSSVITKIAIGLVASPVCHDIFKLFCALSMTYLSFTHSIPLHYFHTLLNFPLLFVYRNLHILFLLYCLHLI